MKNKMNVYVYDGATAIMNKLTLKGVGYDSSWDEINEAIYRLELLDDEPTDEDTGWEIVEFQTLQSGVRVCEMREIKSGQVCFCTVFPDRDQYRVTPMVATRRP